MVRHSANRLFHNINKVKIINALLHIGSQNSSDYIVKLPASLIYLEINMTSPDQYSILVIDDSAMIRKVMVKMLEGAGYTLVTQAECGNDAINALKNATFNLVLCDLYMPDISGIEVLKFAKSSECSSAGSPFIMITSEMDPAVVNEAKSLGADLFLVKPFSKALFEQKVIGTIQA